MPSTPLATKLRIVGWTLIIHSSLIVILHLWVIPNWNLLQLRDYPITTIFTFGSNQQYHYDFRAPLELFEYLLVFSLIIGVGLVALSLSLAKKADDDKVE